MEILLRNSANRSLKMPEAAFLANERYIREVGYYPLSTFWDVDSYSLHKAKNRAVPQCGGYDQARLLQMAAGLQQVPLILVTTTPITIPSPVGIYSIAKLVAGVVTITVPAAITGVDDGKQQIWYNAQTQANIVSFTGANLLSVGVAKTTITFTAALVGEFARTMSIGTAYICLDIVTTGGGTLA